MHSGILTPKLKMKYDAIKGVKFGRLLVVDFDCFYGKRKTPRMLCACDCGEQSKAYLQDLKNGTHSSCGCLRSENTSSFNKSRATHNISNTPTYVSWASMMERCFSEKAFKWSAYGAKGIIPCDFIKASPLNLISAIGERPTNKTIDRINNDLGYYCGKCEQCLEKGWPKNIRWLTNLEQSRNKTSNHFITIAGETKCVKDWAEILGINRLTLAWRHRQGWQEPKLTRKVA